MNKHKKHKELGFLGFKPTKVYKLANWTPLKVLLEFQAK